MFVSSVGSGVCVLTNQSGLVIQEGGALKRQELKHSVSVFFPQMLPFSNSDPK